MMLRHFRSLSLSLLLVLLLMLAVPALAQYRASLQGTITDPTGAVVQGAKVTALDAATGKTVTSVTSDTGYYRIAGLPPGKYKVTVEAPSFKTQVIEGVTVNAEVVNGRDIQMTA